MKKKEARTIARHYQKHTDLWRKAKLVGDKELAQYELGLRQMALQIFEENMLSHGYGSPAYALKNRKKDGCK